MKKIVMRFVGIILILLALRGAIIGLIGTDATAVITESKQLISSSSKASDYNYLVYYSFSDSSEKKVTGSYQLDKVYDTAALPKSGTVLQVRYLKFYSDFSMASGKLFPGLYDFLLMGIGVLLLIFGQIKIGK